MPGFSDQQVLPFNPHAENIWLADREAGRNAMKYTAWSLMSACSTSVIHFFATGLLLCDIVGFNVLFALSSELHVEHPVKRCSGVNPDSERFAFACFDEQFHTIGWTFWSMV
jgi:hypothetical protein